MTNPISGGWKDCGASPLVSGATIFKKGGLTVLLERHADGLMHASVTAHKRSPTYQELKRVRYELMPLDRVVVQIFPPETEFVNLHTGCFHLWELAPHEAPPEVV